jgi:nucleoside-diphosphate-sugar epimerase
MELVVIRPPLIYGPGVKGNFRTLISLCRKGWPLPFGAINNERSFVSIDNLVSLITICIDHTNAANEVFLVSDGDDLSTPMLIKLISKALRKQVFLLSVPQWIIANTLKMLGKQSLAERLCGTLRVDIDKTRKLLGWEPSVSVEEGIRRCVQGMSQ